MANMGIERRAFLKQLGLGILTLGLSEAGLFSLGNGRLPLPGVDKYFQAWADPSVRKLALLVGINQYPRGSSLYGCVTDVELQQELLINRFGFHQGDILTLTDQQATREDIETAFVEHLVQQAKATDVVVFHFSGYGSRVKVNKDTNFNYLDYSDAENSDYQLVNSLVPVDGILQTKGKPAVNDLLEETLILLGRSLATDRVTMVLDTSYLSTGKLLEGNFRVRVCPQPPAEKPTSDELAFQKQVLLNPNLVGNQPPKTGKSGQIQGVIISAADHTQPAVEAKWNNFTAGLFTHALTQYLWQALPAPKLYFSLVGSGQSLSHLRGNKQQPQLISHLKPNSQSPPTYYLDPKPKIGAEGVIRKVEEDGKGAQLYLAGLPATVLRNYSANSVLQVMSSLKGANMDTYTSVPIGKLQIRELTGLTAPAKLVGELGPDHQLQEGQLVQELVRVLPRNLGLNIAVAAQMSRIERVDATSAFSNIPAVSTVVMAGESMADCLLSRIAKSSTPVTNGKNTSQEGGGYGLFSPGNQLIPNTAGLATEAIKSAVNRLSPQLENLLAAKMLQLTVNMGSSRLPITASLEQVKPEPKILITKASNRSNSDLEFSLSNSGQSWEFPVVEVGSQLQYRLTNHSDRPAYILIIGIDSHRNAFVLGSQSSSESAPTSISSQKPSPNILIKPQESLTLPSSDTLAWRVTGAKGLTEVYLIASTAPFTETLTAISSGNTTKNKEELVIEIVNPLAVTKALLEDLHVASTISEEITSSNNDFYALDVNNWASLSFICQVGR